jgi:hypothetical protein
MFTIKTTKAHTIVKANNFVVGAGYKHMLVLAEAHDGIVDTDKKTKLAKITFGDTDKANKFVAEFTKAYTEAHKAYTSKPKASKEDKPSSPKKTTKGKGNKKMSLNDFIVNDPSCTRDEAKAYGFKGTRADLRALKVELGVR